MKMRATFLALLVSLLGLSQAFAAGPIKNPKLSALAKTRDRDERGRFLANVKPEAIRTRAFLKYQARVAKNLPGDAESDYLAAKRELQAEARAANASQKNRALALKLGAAWGAKVVIDKKLNAAKK